MKKCAHTLAPLCVVFSALGACGLETTYAEGFAPGDGGGAATDVSETPSAADDGTEIPPDTAEDTTAPVEEAPPTPEPTPSCEDDNSCDRCPSTIAATVADFEFGNLAQAQSQAETFRVEYLARMSADAPPGDGYVGLSSGAIGNFPDISAQVRFSTAGTFDARDFDVFDSDANIPYSLGEWYHVVIDVDLVAQQYDVAVRPCNGAAPAPLITGARFRNNGTSPSSLDNVGFWAEAGSTIDVSDVRWDVGP